MVDKAVNQYLPSLRKPGYNSNFEVYKRQLGWVYQKRSKVHGYGWQSYYEAMNTVWVSACIDAYVNTVTNLDYLIHNPNSETVNNTKINYLNNLFQNPMGLDSNITYEIYQKQMWSSFLGIGDAFTEVIYDHQYDKVPVGLQYIPAHCIQYYEDTDQWGLINGHRFEKDHIIHIKDADVQGSPWGESKLDKLARDIYMETLGLDYTKELLENKGLDPRGAIEYDSSVSASSYELQEARLKAQSQSPSRLGTIVLHGGHYNKIGNSNQDMQFTELLTYSRDRTLALYGVPPSMVSIIETANLGSGSGLSQQKQFKKTFKGKAKLFEKAYTKILGRSIFDEIFEYGDLDIQDMKERAEIENIRINNGSLTVNEVRQGYGQEPVSWGDNNPNMNLNNGIDNGLAGMGLLL